MSEQYINFIMHGATIKIMFQLADYNRLLLQSLLIVKKFNTCKNSIFSSIFSIVALGRTTECPILPLVRLLMFSWTRTLGSGSQLYHAVNSCIIHCHQSLMSEIEQSPKHHKFIVCWHGRSLSGLCCIQLLWKLGISYKIHHSLEIQCLLCYLGNVISYNTEC